MAKPNAVWKYGDPPHSWKDLATHLQQSATKPKKKSSGGLMDRITAIEQLLKEKK